LYKNHENGVFQKETCAERLEKRRACREYIKIRQGFNLQGQPWRCDFLSCSQTVCWCAALSYFIYVVKNDNTARKRSCTFRTAHAN
jgi:hypothetical protein